MTTTNLNKMTTMAVLLALTTSALTTAPRMLSTHADRELLFTENPDKDRPFPEWLQYIYFGLSCLMILGGIISCVMCAGNKAGHPNPELNDAGMGTPIGGPGGMPNNMGGAPNNMNPNMGGMQNNMNTPNMNNQSLNGSMMPLNNRNGY